ncbi:MAG: DUF4230 domain-containing protein [Actinomycetes bacterium]
MSVDLLTRPTHRPERAEEPFDRGDRRRRRGGFRSGLTLVAVIAVAVAVAMLAHAIGTFHLGLFGTTKVDRSAPVVLRQIREVESFTAATGEFESTVDIRTSVDPLPAFLAGEHTIFVGVGRVDAAVDFSGLASDAVTVDADRTVHVRLPAPRLGTPVIDLQRSRVASRDRGLADRLAGVFADNPTSEHGLAVHAQHRIARAAARSDLATRAEANTTRLVQGLLGTLGYDRVDVTYAA